MKIPGYINIRNISIAPFCITAVSSRTIDTVCGNVIYRLEIELTNGNHSDLYAKDAEDLSAMEAELEKEIEESGGWSSL